MKAYKNAAIKGGKMVHLGTMLSQIKYIIKDLFDTQGSAPLDSPHTANIGAYNVIDTENKLSISSGALQIAGGKTIPSGGDPGIYAASLARLCGNAVFAEITPTAANTIFYFGFDDNGSGIPTRMSISFENNANLKIFDFGQSSFSTYGYVANTTYIVGVIMRNAGAWMIIKGGGFTDWTLLGVADISLSAGIPCFANNTMSGKLDNFIVGTLKKVDYTSSYGLAKEYKPTSVNSDTITAEVNSIIEHTITAATGVAQELIIRRTDDNNCWIIRCDQTNSTIKLFQKQGGTETERATAAQAFTNGTKYRILGSLNGNAIYASIDGAHKLLYTSASFNNTAVGVKVSHAGEKLVAWKRTLPSPFDTPPNDTAIMPFGDSKTYGTGDDIPPAAGTNGYPTILINSLTSETKIWAENPIRIAKPGWTVAMFKASIDTDLAAKTAVPDYILFNLGANDIQPLADPVIQATWESDLGYILDAMHTKWPRTKIYVAKVWRRYNNGQMADLNDTWIPNVLSTRNTFAFAGIDERTFLPSTDNGITYTVDGIHPNRLGYTLTAAEWKTAIGI